MPQQLDIADSVRRTIAPSIAQKRKSALGQFMTPSSIARFMASLFPLSRLQTCHLLDAGAGVGALSCAFLDRWTQGDFSFEAIEVTAYEIDSTLHDHLAHHLSAYPQVSLHVVLGDYIELVTTEPLQSKGYTHVILNPPYRKINRDSAHRLALRHVGIETVNLYSAFVALALAQSAPGGQLVAIIPRSFCNGPYYRSFRDFILEHAAIRHMHLFASRSKAFKDDEVLQENLIIRLERGGQQGTITVSTSTDDTFVDLSAHDYPFERIVFPDDAERFIHVPTSLKPDLIEQSPSICSRLADLGISVSTGPVVDFRLKGHLRDMPGPNTVPLLYPSHFSSKGILWPIKGMKKPNAIERNTETEKWLYPSGYYCIVRRFSSKEEKRRIVASVVEPTTFDGVKMLGFENHLNLFHENRHGLPKPLAYGLVVFLSTTAVDEHFRRFNGHTQVNATDLKLMKYPSRDMLIQLGEWAIEQEELTQATVDAKFESLTS